MKVATCGHIFKKSVVTCLATLHLWILLQKRKYCGLNIKTSAVSTHWLSETWKLICIFRHSAWQETHLGPRCQTRLPRSRPIAFCPLSRVRDSDPIFELTCIPFRIAFYENNMRGEDGEADSFKSELWKEREKKKKKASSDNDGGSRSAGGQGGEEQKKKKKGRKGSFEKHAVSGRGVYLCSVYPYLNRAKKKGKGSSAYQGKPSVWLHIHPSQQTVKHNISGRLLHLISPKQPVQRCCAVSEWGGGQMVKQWESLRQHPWCRLDVWFNSAVDKWLRLCCLHVRVKELVFGMRRPARLTRGHIVAFLEVRRCRLPAAARLQGRAARRELADKSWVVERSDEKPCRSHHGAGNSQGSPGCFWSLFMIYSGIHTIFWVGAGIKQVIWKVEGKNQIILTSSCQEMKVVVCMSADVLVILFHALLERRHAIIPRHDNPTYRSTSAATSAKHQYDWCVYASSYHI